jgi:hypothetical protein
MRGLLHHCQLTRKAKNDPLFKLMRLADFAFAC